MRVLRFIVDGSNIIQDPSCDFSGLFPGSETCIKAEFAFSQEWTGMIKVAAFWSIIGSEYPPQILDDTNSCLIPNEALIRPAFKIQLLGKSAKTMIKTNNITVYQRGGTM